MTVRAVRARLGGGVPALLLMLLAALAVAACSPRYQPMGPAVTEPRLETDRIVAADGHELPLRRWLPDPRLFPEPAAAVVALHGLNDYSRAFEGAGPAWARLGIATYAYDQRGFGATARRGIWPTAETLAADAAMAVGLVARAHPDTPVFLLGESLGGGVAILLLAEGGAPEVEGAVLVAPATWSREIMRVWQRMGLDVSRTLVPALEMTGEGLTIRPTDNEAVLQAMRADPMILRANRVDLLAGAVDLMSRADTGALQLASQAGPPLLVLFGENEEVLPGRAVDRVVGHLQPLAEIAPEETGNHLTTERRALVIYPEGWHMLLRDRQGPRVIADVARWILARAAEAEAPESP